MTDTFLESREWLELRYRVLKKGKGCCQLCGCRGDDKNPLQVDHIKPRSKHPGLALIESNLQVLCRSCNVGKSNKDKTDWRMSASRELSASIALRTAILEIANPEQKAKLEQLGWLRRNDVDAHIRKEAEKQYKAIWKKLEDELKARGT